jgi:hypothetical protein
MTITGPKHWKFVHTVQTTFDTGLLHHNFHFSAKTQVEIIFIKHEIRLMRICPVFLEHNLGSRFSFE